MTLPHVNAKLLDGKKGLIVGIANDRSIAWGCARAFRALGAEVAITYLNDKAKPHVEPLAREVEAPIFMPMDVMADGQLEAVFDRIAADWGKLDFLVHSIAFSTKDALGGRVVDVPRQGFQVTMDVSVWSFLRMAHLAEPLMKDGGTLFTMTYYGSQKVVEDMPTSLLRRTVLNSSSLWFIEIVHSAPSEILSEAQRGNHARRVRPRRSGRRCRRPARREGSLEPGPTYEARRAGRSPRPGSVRWDGTRRRR